MNNVSILIADDHTIVRKGLISLLEEEGNIEIVAEAGNGREAIELYQEHNPDVTIMDLTMPDLNGIEATSRILDKDCDAKVLILTVHSEKEYIARILKAGAAGYVIKKSAPSQLKKAIKTVLNDNVYLSPSVTKVVVSEYFQDDDFEISDKVHNELTDREIEVLQLIAEGNSTEAISSKLYISTNTVATHRRNIMKKLNIDNIAELTQYAIRRGLISQE